MECCSIQQLCFYTMLILDRGLELEQDSLNDILITTNS